jgi:hypothetical protein
MGMKVQNEAADRARAARLAQITHQNSPDMHELEEEQITVQLMSTRIQTTIVDMWAV